jgi:hypothetical protein
MTAVDPERTFDLKNAASIIGAILIIGRKDRVYFSPDRHLRKRWNR